jgi:hypothetical protein
LGGRLFFKGGTLGGLVSRVSFLLGAAGLSLDPIASMFNVQFDLRATEPVALPDEIE